MKFVLPLITCLSFAAIATPAQAQGMVSVSMGQPGFYGRIQIGGYPQPELIFANSVTGDPGIYTGPPVYMHVPPAHAHRWNHYCHDYGACELMVYFVQPSWYNNVYVPGFRAQIGYAPEPIYAPPPYYYVPPRYIHRHHGHHHHSHGGHHHGHPRHGDHRHDSHRHDSHRHDHGRGGHDRR